MKSYYSQNTELKSFAAKNYRVCLKWKQLYFQGVILERQNELLKMFIDDLQRN